MSGRFSKESLSAMAEEFLAIAEDADDTRVYILLSLLCNAFNIPEQEAYKRIKEMIIPKEGEEK